MQKRKTKKELFLELAQPDETGLSRQVPVNQFVGKYQELAYRNGCPWARSLNEFQVYIHKEKGKSLWIQLRGFKEHRYNPAIKASIKKAILSKPCVVTNTTHNIECDHKDGFKQFDIAPENQTEDLFQPLAKSINAAKREHCKRCRHTKIRFDAKKLGYGKSQWKGGSRYEGTCKGCYWHDPPRFNKEMSDHFFSKKH